MDVSADLTELGRTPVAVVCAGVKSILDIPRTLEYLETQVGGGRVEGTEWSATGTGQRPAKLHASPYRQRQLLHLSPKAALSVTCTKCQLQLPVANPALLASFTQGVCVAALGSDEFPAFFTPHSGCRAPFRVESPAQAAAMVDASRRLGLEGGMVLGEPCCLLVCSPFHCADTCDTQQQARRADEKAACRPLRALLLQRWAG